MSTNTDKPRAQGDMKCPLWKKPMRQVCHTCSWWTHIRGKHPQGEEIFDQWGCAIAWMPILTIENSMMQRQTGMAVDQFANVVHQSAEEATAARADLIGKVVRSLSAQQLTAQQLRDQIGDASDHPRLR